MTSTSPPTKLKEANVGGLETTSSTSRSSVTERGKYFLWVVKFNSLNELTRGVLPYFANFRLISELSTPFVNQRWFFEALKYPRSNRLVVINGVAMAAVFFLVRCAVMPSYWSSVFATFGTEAFTRLGLAAQVAWISSCIALDILNVIWMYKIARGCYKVIKGRGGARKGKEEVSEKKEVTEKEVEKKDGKHVNNHTD
ncbi:transmembrane protein 56-B-like [Notothenia coriiceps]|uniref:Transmembrane protein 56-B-like n=1 Tax=Notothenia coriiceps TaxID=8208 RepID=A0A6I9Q603_9TELE|nr:PREDICTED: transmembrane protein 56-B-like [Notothenia coriiceps]